MTHIIAPALAVFASAALLTGCGTSNSEKALNLAREACNVDLPSVGDGSVLTDSTVRQQMRDEALPKVEEIANKAAQAARLDQTWQTLATASDQLAELVSNSIDLGNLRATRVDDGYATPGDVDKDTQLEARIQELTGKNIPDTIHAECRKTT